MYHISRGGIVLRSINQTAILGPKNSLFLHDTFFYVSRFRSDPTNFGGVEFQKKLINIQVDDTFQKGHPMMTNHFLAPQWRKKRD